MNLKNFTRIITVTSLALVTALIIANQAYQKGLSEGRSDYDTIKLAYVSQQGTLNEYREAIQGYQEAAESLGAVTKSFVIAETESGQIYVQSKDGQEVVATYEGSPEADETPSINTQGNWMIIDTVE